MLLKPLYKITILKNLWISGYTFDTEREWDILEEFIRKNTAVIYLDLSRNSLFESKNELGLEGGKALDDALCNNIENNEFGSEGGIALVEGLSTNTNLTSLNLSENNFGSEVVEVPARALCKNIALTLLNLSYNRFGEEGEKALV
ncbi:protein nlrc3 [Gigaspora margarita]|uniref:Protein nlrc3 n=1 Tax=Gigaspora margarita TaxID=4874 RepID=A0A8H3XKA8_GIGMA|nr:protein nlrc3 [Gigaspora margarita]